MCACRELCTIYDTRIECVFAINAYAVSVCVCVCVLVFVSEKYSVLNINYPPILRRRICPSTQSTIATLTIIMRHAMVVLCIIFAHRTYISCIRGLRTVCGRPAVGRSIECMYGKYIIYEHN